MAATDFPHLALDFVVEGRARLSGGGSTSERTQFARQHRTAHVDRLRREFRAQLETWQTLAGEVVTAGMPLLLHLDEADDTDDLCRKLGLELVGESEDGFVVAALVDLNAADLLAAFQRFVEERRGGGAVAQLHEFGSTEERLERILSPTLLDRWPTIADTDLLDLCVSLSAGSLQVSNGPERKEGESEAEFETRVDHWRTAKLYPALEQLDNQRAKRAQAFQTFVRPHGGQIFDITDGPPCRPADPDYADASETFEVKTRLSGTAFRDLVLTFPFVLEVTEDEDMWAERGAANDGDTAWPQLQAPKPDAPRVCVIDSGIQEQHPLVGPAVARQRSRCFLPELQPTNVTDEVSAGGHGTRVAATVLFEPEAVQGQVVEPACWVENARVLDADCRLPSSVSPAGLVNAVVDHFGDETSLFVHAINGQAPSRTARMSSWAAALDDRSHRDDVLFVQAAGNTSYHDRPPPLCPTLKAYEQEPYPAPLLHDGRFRIPNPAQALHALTVGALATATWSDANYATLTTANQPATYTRVGPGIWNSIKPEVVVPVGDYAFHRSAATGAVLRPDTCRPLVRKAIGAAPLVAADAVGTSFAAPRVARLAAQLAQLLPDEHPLLYRALIVQSARWPSAMQSWSPEDRVRTVGYGVVDDERALGNAPHRVTLIASGRHTVQARQAKVFSVPVPAAMRDPANDAQVRVEVTLAYTASVRRKRRQARRYLGVWVDWKASKRGETRAAFEARVFYEGSEDDKRNDKGMPWVFGVRADQGHVDGYRFNAGTVQKDWADVPAYDLPEEFLIAVVGHPGWDRDPEAAAKFSLVVSFESLDQSIEVYAEHVKLRQRVAAV